MAAADFSQVAALGVDLGKASATVTRKAGQVIAKAAHDIEARAKSTAPVDTGALRNSISTTNHGLTAEVGPTVNYGAYLEFGTSRMAPRPYLGPAADAVEPAFVAAMSQLVEEETL